MNTTVEIPAPENVPGTSLSGTNKSDRNAHAFSAPRVHHLNSSRASLAALLIVWIVSLGWLGVHLNRGWVSHDDGMLSHGAERVMQGQLPHRDFDEVYTGGLNYLHAAAFYAFGTNLMSLRFALFCFFALWVPAFYYCASRFGGPVAAGLTTLLAVAWSVPNYPASMPSWYNLFFATFGVAALLRYLEVRSSRWLFLAGISGGLSFLIKSPGLYFIGAALLFLLFQEQTQALFKSSDESLENTSRSGKNEKLYRLMVTAIVIAFVTALTVLVHKVVYFSELYFFVLPGLSLGMVLLSRESAGTHSTTLARFRNFLQIGIPFLAGVALPLAIFLIPYIASHSLGSIFVGVFVTPFKRVGTVVYPPPGLGDLIALPPVLGILAFACFSKRRESLLLSSVVLAALAGIVWGSSHNGILYQLAWMSAGTAIPAIVLIGSLILARARRGRALTPLRRSQIFLLLCATAMCSLIQFPYSSATYFCYVAPLLALTALAAISSRKDVPRILPALVASFYIAFMVFRVTPGFQLDSMSRRYELAQYTVPLEMARGKGLNINPGDAEIYNRLIPFIQQKASNGIVYAGPDCPEVYFLSGLHDPTRMTFDVFEDYSQETSRVLTAINNSNPSVVVINRLPAVSTALPPDLRQALEVRFPQMVNMGKFQVRWRP